MPCTRKGIPLRSIPIGDGGVNVFFCATIIIPACVFKIRKKNG